MPALVIADGTGSGAPVVVPCASVLVDAEYARCGGLVRDPAPADQRVLAAVCVAPWDLFGAIRALTETGAPLDEATIASLRDGVVVSGRPGADGFAWCGPLDDEVGLFACTGCEVSTVQAAKCRPRAMALNTDAVGAIGHARYSI